MRGILPLFKPREHIAAACDNLSGSTVVRLVCCLYDLNQDFGRSLLGPAPVCARIVTLIPVTEENKEYRTVTCLYIYYASNLYLRHEENNYWYRTVLL